MKRLLFHMFFPDTRYFWRRCVFFYAANGLSSDWLQIARQMLASGFQI